MDLLNGVIIYDCTVKDSYRVNTDPTSQATFSGFQLAEGARF